jgi:hypothetical protein
MTHEIKMISSAEELRQNPEIIAMLNEIVSASEAVFNKVNPLKSLTSKEKAWKVEESWLAEFEATNKTVLFVEQDGKPQSLLVYMTNDPETRNNLKIEGNFVIMIKAISTAESRNSGLLGLLIQEAQNLTENLNPSYFSCVLAKEIEGKEPAFRVMNLDRYAHLHEKNFNKNQLQIRFKDEKGSQFGREKVDLNEFMENGKINDTKLSELIIQQKEVAKKINQEMVGFYIIGDSKKKWVDRINHNAGRSRI